MGILVEGYLQSAPEASEADGPAGPYGEAHRYPGRAGRYRSHTTSFEETTR
jgi:hypothetical protein